MKSQLYSMSLLNSDILKRTDFLILSGGRDYRAYEILRRCKNLHIKIGQTILFNFQERTKNLTDADTYNEYKNLGIEPKLVPCSINDPSSCVRSLISSGINLSNVNKVAIDISCFPQPYFFLLLKYLKETARIGSIIVYYTEPKNYVFPGGLFYSYHSTYGPVDIMEIPGFPGRDTRISKKTLVVLLGFDGDLSSLIKEDIAIIVNGFPSFLPKFKDISLINNEKLIASSGSAKLIRYSIANNPFETFNLLDRIKSEYKSSALNIAPIGPKPMALGACLFAIENTDVRIVYPFPEEYADVTTRDCWQSWYYEISF
jgi:hypothetical protein